MEKVAFLFAGQGSQYIGMGKDLYEAFSESADVFEKANQVLGFKLSDICFDGKPEDLKQTIISQPAIFTVSLAAFYAFKARFSIQPAFVAGLSLGEYSALVAAEALTFADGLRLVRKRSQLMEDACSSYPGKMAAILNLSTEKIKEICLKTQAEIANLNAPGQVVISGTKEAVEKAAQICIQAGAKRVVELEVSGGFHSSLMLKAASELKDFLVSIPIHNPRYPIVSNYTADIETNVSQIIDNLVYQMHSPVRWEESMNFLLKQGITRFYEFGPGRVLKGLMRKIEPTAEVICIEKKEDILALSKGA